MPEGILERLAKGPVLGDGGYVYILRQRGLPMVGYSPTALKAAQSTGLVTMVTMSCKPVLTSREGFQMDYCAKFLKDEGADIVGLNCMQDPALMLPLMERIRKAVDGPIAAQPVAVECHPHAIHMGEREGPWTDHVLPPQALADFARRALEIGIDYIGSCCGSGPEHVRAMAEAMGEKPR